VKWRDLYGAHRFLQGRLSRRRAGRDYLQGAVWVLPGLGIVLGLVGGALLSMVHLPPGSALSRVAFQGSVNDAQQVLTTVSATMITLTGVEFALTVLALQIASSQFSVRLLRTFLRDVPNQVVLAIFVCTFAYGTGGLYTVGQRAGGGSFVPQVAVSGALALAFVSTAALVYFLHHLMHSIQIDSVIESAQQRTLALVDELFPDADNPGASPLVRPAPPPDAAPLLAPQSGYLQTVDIDGLAELADQSGHTISLVVSVGDYVTATGLLSCEQIRRHGSHDPLVLMALLQMLSSVAARCVDPSRRADVQAQIDHVVLVAERELVEPSDLAMVSASADRATAVVNQPGMLAPPPSMFGQVAAAAAIRRSTGDGDAAVDCAIVASSRTNFTGDVQKNSAQDEIAQP